MSALHRDWIKWLGALVIVAAQTPFAMAAPANPAPNATDNAQLMVRLQRLERDMRDLEAKLNEAGGRGM